MNNVTYYPFLHFFPENFELTKFQFPIAAGLVIWIKEKDLLHKVQILPEFISAVPLSRKC